MKKRFSSLISSFHGSCKSKEEISSSALPPIFYIPPARRRRMAAPAVVPQEETRRSSPAMVADDMSRARETTPAYLWMKEEKWHVVLCSEELAESAVVQEDDEEDHQHQHEDSPSSTITELTDTKSLPREMVLQRKNRERKNLIRLRSRISTSSSHDTSCFSSEDDKDERDNCVDEEEEDEDQEYEDETNTLLSSLSFTSNTVRPSYSRLPEPRTVATSAVGMLKRLAVPCGTEEGKAVQESFAVVKRSEDPRGDFRRSIAEMVVEKRMCDAADLEQLLHCFLSLNSRHHHRAIVSAFSDIWQTLFPDNSPNFSRSYKQH